jgi:hypothetical protein
VGCRGNGGDPLSAAAPVLSLDDFSPWVGGAFEVGVAADRLPMTLRAAELLAGGQRDGGGFRLEFLGPSDPVLAQSIMTVAGPNGTHDIFLVPIAQNSDGTRYEAIFY